jgi:hypothetical protein
MSVRSVPAERGGTQEDFERRAELASAFDAVLSGLEDDNDQPLATAELEPEPVMSTGQVAEPEPDFDAQSMTEKFVRVEWSGTVGEDDREGWLRESFARAYARRNGNVWVSGEVSTSWIPTDPLAVLILRQPNGRLIRLCRAQAEAYLKKPDGRGNAIVGMTKLPEGSMLPAALEQAIAIRPEAKIVAERSYEILPMGLRFKAGTTYEQWERDLGGLLKVERRIQWCVADALAWGSDVFGERASQALDPDSYTYQTLSTLAWVARKIPQERRRAGVPFSVHQEVAGLPPEEQDRLRGSPRSRCASRSASGSRSSPARRRPACLRPSSTCSRWTSGWATPRTCRWATRRWTSS